MSQPDAETLELHHKYWRSNIHILGVLLLIWFGVSYGCGILFREALDQFSIGGAPLGFWFAQQGSILSFLAILLIYKFAMDRLDHKYGFDEVSK